MNMARIALKTLFFKARAFEKATRDPIKAQKRVLFEYLARNNATEYGLKYRFSKITSIKDYQNIVPMSDCEVLRPYIERMTRGEDNILTSDRPVFFGLTSGTTGHPKFIPVTKYSRVKKAEVSSLWAYYILRDHPGIFKGKVLAVVNAEKEGSTESGCLYGAETGHGYKNIPRLVRDMYAIPYVVYTVKDYASRYYCIMRMGMEHDVTTVAALNPSTIMLLCQMAEEWKDDIIHDIERGALRGDLDIPVETKREIEKHLKPNARRAGELRGILDADKRLLPKYFWPNIQLIECWKGGPMRLYLEDLRQYFGDVPIRDFGCLSTETRSSIPMSDTGAGGVLAINTNFYEFVREEEMEMPKRRFLLCDELEVGKEYFLIVTTPGGLYRYNIDDIIKVNGFFNRTPIIEFAQKGLNVVSLMGEKVYEVHVSEAVSRAAAENKILMKFFSASVQLDKPPRYIFLVEFLGDPRREEKEALLRSIEEGLGRENAEYRYARESLLLGEPIMKVVAPGAFERYRTKRIAEGARDSQFKAPELTSNPAFQKNFEIGEEIHFKAQPI
jgi:hypothetical protein